MAWIRERARKDGGITYVVTWREPGDSKESTLSIKDDKGLAEQQVRLLDANGQSYAAAERAVDNAKVGGLTTKEAILKHIDLLTSAGPGTITRYRNAVRDHFSGQLGLTPVAALRHDDVVVWIRYMQAKRSRKTPTQGYAAKTIANHHGLLSAAMETAIRKGLREDNPCRGISLPKDDSIEEKMHFLSAEDSLAIVRALPPRYQALTAFLRATGVRWGECTALYAKDFKLDAAPPTVRIERAWKSDGGNGFYLGPPKTKKSRRSVSLPPSLVAEIRPLVERAANDGGWVFRELNGEPVRQSKFFNYWKRALDRLGYPAEAGQRPRIHDLRHTHASLMLGGGMSPYELSRRLGHESIRTTVDRYSHLVPDAHFRGADIAEAALSGGELAALN